MPTPVKKKCTNASCASKDIVITTAKENCLLCDRPLVAWSPLGDIFGKDGILSDLFGGGFR